MPRSVCELMHHLPNVKLVDSEDTVRVFKQSPLHFVHIDVRRHCLQQDHPRLDEQRPRGLKKSVQNGQAVEKRTSLAIFWLLYS